MALDPYSPCPGGKGKKVKFCCPDLLNELEKIQRMLAGDQQRACLDYITQLEQKFPDRACLLTTKAILQGELGDAEGAKATTGKVLAAEPDNPVALAEAALLSISSEGARSGVEPLQRAIAAGKETMAANVFEALGALAGALAAEGYWAAALAHAAMLLAIRPDHRAAYEILFGICSSREVALPFKDYRRPFDEGPVESAWQKDFEAALDAAQSFRWLEAAERLARLAERAPQAPAVWRNLARLRGYLADEAAAAEAYRRYARLDVALDDAVEAEMMAQLTAAENEQDRVDLVFLEYPINDLEQLDGRLGSCPYAERLNPDEAVWDDPDQPPPRTAFMLLDRPLPASAAGLTLADVPHTVCQLFLFGRETDRPARMSLAVHRDQLTAAQARLAEVAGDSLGSAGAEQVIGSSSRIDRVMKANWRLPRDTTLDQLQSLNMQHVRKAYFETWPKTPSALFGGQTPEAAAGDPAFKTPLLAAILILELTAEDESLDFNELRGRLGLPLESEIELGDKNPSDFPVAYLHRLAADKLTDDELAGVYHTSFLTNARRAQRKFAAEAVARPDQGKIDKSQAYGLLASFAKTFDQALECIDQARKAAEAAGKSSAPWDLEELTLRLGHGDGAGAERVLHHIQSAHGREPGVRQRLMQLFYQAGLIDEQGRPVGRPAEEPAGIVVPGGSTEAAGKLWTPGAETGEGKKSALWVPGMD